jgi:hypothetical protein
MIMRKPIALALATFVVTGMALSKARADSMCTAWNHLASTPRSQDLQSDTPDTRACVADIRAQVGTLPGVDASGQGDTVFFWFDRGVVTARCLSRTVVAFAAYHPNDNEACPLKDRIYNRVRWQ